MQFYIDISDAAEDIYEEDIIYPKYNYPSHPGVQLAIHSPYLSLSPFAIGQSFQSGKLYQIKIQQVGLEDNFKTIFICYGCKYPHSLSLLLKKRRSSLPVE